MCTVYRVLGEHSDNEKCQSSNVHSRKKVCNIATRVYVSNLSSERFREHWSKRKHTIRTPKRGCQLRTEQWLKTTRLTGRALAIQNFKKIIFILSWSLLRRRRLLVLSRLIELNWYFTASYMAKISYLLILLIVLLVLLMILLPLGSRSVTTWIGLLDYRGWCWAWILPVALKILYIETKTFNNSNFTFL